MKPEEPLTRTESGAMPRGGVNPLPIVLDRQAVVL